MNFELVTLFAIGAGYLALLFGIAFVTERGWIPEKLVRHPAIYTLSLGVFASVWAFYTAVSNAYRDGYGYLAHYIGISLAFLLSPLMLRPLLELTRTYQLSSLADLLAFRYRSRWAGTITTIVILIGVTPLLALQIQAVADTIGILAPDISQDALAFTFCLLITAFAILFGTSNHSGKQRHDGLVMAIAFESVVKLLALLAIGLFAVYAGFGGFSAMQEWVNGQPGLQEALHNTGYSSTFHLTILLFFTAAVAMPHMFYMTFSENNSLGKLRVASWGIPLYFLLLSLPILPILWAGMKSGSAVPVEYFPVIIGIEYDSSLLALVGFTGGLSAASGLIIVVTLALSNMCLNHLILPVYQPTAQRDIYRWLLWNRRLLTVALIWAGFFFYYLPNNSSSLQVVGNVAFAACLQFLPCIIALLYWPGANKKGFLSGILAGVSLWFLFLMLPLTTEPDMVTSGRYNWASIAVLSLLVNSVLFVLVSLFTSTSTEERNSAEVCAINSSRRLRQSGLLAKSPSEFISRLSKPLGIRTAKREVMQALQDLNIDEDERRPLALRMLRGRLEANLSGLLGPNIAHEIVTNFLPYRVVSEHGIADVNLIENRIEAYRRNLSGMAADLDNLRRYHRQILLDLPLGVCSLGADNEITLWNYALEKFTGVSTEEVQGLQLTELPEPWLSLLNNFINGDSNHVYKQNFQYRERRRTVNLHKSLIEREDQGDQHAGVIILLEDLTETELLEEGLTHSERLASIGRLAAGVAHEIGNPITGIACLAQNIRDEFEDRDLRAMAEQIIEQTNRTSRIVQSLVNFAHAGTSNSQYDNVPVCIRDCIDEAITLVSLDKKGKSINYVVDCEEDCQIMGDSQRLLQVILNLINNARDASKPDSTILFECRRRGDQVQIVLTDEGIGIAPAIRDRIFDPFFTTKEAGEGTGLGLSLVFSIVQDLNGSIDIISPADTVRNVGTRVVLGFPGINTNNKKRNEASTGTNDRTASITITG